MNAPGSAAAISTKSAAQTTGLAVPERKEMVMQKGTDGSPPAHSNFAAAAVSPTPARMVSNSGIGKRLLTFAEAAGYLGLQVDTVYKKARLRELPSVKVGRALRFDVIALERYVEQHTIGTLDRSE